MTIERVIKIKERGKVPRKMRKQMNNDLKASWYQGGKLFHEKLRDRRFNTFHARAARYRIRSERYQRRKQLEFGHDRPLELTGETRHAVKIVRITSSAKWARCRYPGARKFNFTSSRGINMAQEFRRIIPRETLQIARRIDKSLDIRLNTDKSVGDWIG